MPLCSSAPHLVYFDANIIGAVLLFFSTLVLFREATCNTLLQGSRYPEDYPPQELEHFPEWFTSTMTPFINGTDTQIPGPIYTPDYRVEEAPFFVHNYWGYLREEERPYRLSPHYKQAYRWPNHFGSYHLACYCTTVYRRFTLLAGCAVLTMRHIITTATATQHVLRLHKTRPTLEGLLGAWYDHNADEYNSSLYMTPARIHYHPKYVAIEDVNASHPIPCMYDLSVWASTFKFPGYYGLINRVTTTCQRAASSFFFYTSTIAQPDDLAIIIGYQFMKAYRRKPMPWYKYGVRTRQHVLPCPKTEWGWFHCIMGDWARLGLDSGAPYHMSFSGRTWRNDGFAGLNAFSMKLRSLQIVHYFTVIDTYPVLDFMYESFLGRQDYEYLDQRFYNSLWMAPRPKPWHKIVASYPYGEVSVNYYVPYY